MSDWNYKGFHEKYNMKEEIKIGTGTVKVHDLFNIDELPKFMLKIDLLFIDPPCSKSNINTFYTKADMLKRHESIEPFFNILFQNIQKISPKMIFIEVFKSNYDYFLCKIKEMYKYVHVYDSKYYNNAKNKCWIIQASNDEFDILDINDLDEEKIIEYICKNLNFKCIGDLVMGTGLVGWYANKYKKKFAGTELNKKRLAILLERITSNKYKI